MSKTLLVQQQQLHFFLVMLMSLFRKKQTAISPLPALVNGFALERELNSGELIKPHRIGIYKNDRGQKGVVKWWSGNKKTFAAISLENELSMAKLLEKLNHRTIKNQKPNLTQIGSAHVITSRVNEKTVFIMSEFHEGKLLREVAKAIQIKEYKRALNYLSSLSGNLTQIEIDALPKRTYIDYLLLYPALLSVSILRQPRYFWTFIKGLPPVLFSLTKIRKHPLTIVHRDLHTMNIIYSPSRTTIIDLQRAVLTYGLYELVTTLAVEWDNKELRQAILDYIYSSYSNSLTIFRGLMIYFATHALTANNLPEYYLSRYKAMLNFAVYKYSNYYLKT